MTTSLRAGSVLFAKNLRKVATFYEELAQLRTMRTADDHIVLESRGYQLIVHALPDDIAGPQFVESPIVVREDCALKLVFFIEDMSEAREAVTRLGGLLHGSEREWQYDGTTVCDGCDPEGNVIQLRQPIANNAFKRRRAKRARLGGVGRAKRSKP